MSTYCPFGTRPLRGNASPSAPLAPATRAYISAQACASVKCNQQMNAIDNFYAADDFVTAADNFKKHLWLRNLFGSILFILVAFYSYFHICVSFVALFTECH